MDSAALSPDQLRQIAARVEPAATYLARLQGRMTSTGFPEDDALRCRVEAAAEALAALHAALADMMRASGGA